MSTNSSVIPNSIDEVIGVVTSMETSSKEGMDAQDDVCETSKD